MLAFIFYPLSTLFKYPTINSTLYTVLVHFFLKPIIWQTQAH